MKSIQRRVGILMFLLFPFFLNAQDFEQIKKQMQEEFDRYSIDRQNGFDDYISKIDQNFSDYLKNAWREYNLFVGIKPDSTPKPNVTPDFKDEPRQKPIDKILPVKPILQKGIDPSIQPRLPGLSRFEPDDYKTNTIDFSFYYQKLSVSYDVNLFVDIPANFSVKNVSNYWDTISQANYIHLLVQMKEISSNLNLNDWGFYKLLETFANQLYPAGSNGSKLLVWYLLTRSDYLIRVGFDGNQVNHLLASSTIIYEKPYYTFNNIRFYLLSSEVQKVITYEQDFPEARILFDLNIYKPLKFKNALTNRTLKVNDHGSEIPLNFTYNKACVEFYNDIPLSDIKLYFDAAFSEEAENSSLSNLKYLITGKTELEAANLILNFVQTGFAYKTDDEQFNAEKYFFPDDNLHYPFCDCEDRSVLFARLIGKLLNLEVIGLEYPGHMATAVAFSSEIQGDHILINEKKFTVCDPTYINAPVGYTMPQFQNVKPTIIILRNEGFKQAAIKKSWDNLNGIGLNPTHNSNNAFIDDKGKVYLTGYFEGEVNSTHGKIKSAGQSDLFLAKMNSEGQTEWIKKIGGSGIDYGNEIVVTSDNQIIVSAFLSGKVMMDQVEVEGNPSGSVAIIAFNDKGNLVWNQVLEIKEKSLEEIFLYELTSSGKILAEKYFPVTKNQQVSGLAIDHEGNVYISGTYTEYLQLKK